MPTITCTKCGKAQEVKATKRGEARLPRGWHRHDGVWCAGCWGNAYMMRAATIPVVGPVNCDWPTLRGLLRTAWGETTRLANWCVSEYYARDVRRQPDDKKLAAAPTVYLYPEARKKFPLLVPSTLVAVDHAVQGKYRASRFKLLWTNEISTPNFRYPFPLPLPTECFRLYLGDGNELLCDVRLSSENTDRTTLRLRGGRDYIRQRLAIEKCIGGEAIAVEATLYRVNANPSDHRNGDIPKQTRIMLKVAAWLPRKERIATTKDRFFSLKTDADSFLVGVLQDRQEPWILNADKVRDWVRQHQRDLRRLAEDRKHEDRRDRNKRRRYKQALAAKSEKFFNRLDSFVKETAAAIVGFAARNKVTRIKWDDSYRDYVDSFPWAKLRTQLTQKCDEFFLTFDVASGNAESKSAEPIAETITTGA